MCRIFRYRNESAAMWSVVLCCVLLTGHVLLCCLKYYLLTLIMSRQCLYDRVQDQRVRGNQ